MNEFYIRSRSKNFAVPPGGDLFSVEYYGPFPSRRNAVLGRNLIRRINANTGRYHDTATTTVKLPSDARVLTWKEWVDCMGEYWPGREETLRWTSPLESATLKA